MDEQGVERVAATTSQPDKQEEGTESTLRSDVIMLVVTVFLFPVGALVFLVQRETGIALLILALYIPSVIFGVMACLRGDKDNVIMRTITSGFESEEDKQRRHEIALAKVKNHGTIEPHRLRSDVERYKADREVDVENLKTAGRLAELKQKILATPAETRSEKMKDDLFALAQLDAARDSANALLPRDADGHVRRVIRNNKSVIDFDSPEIEKAHEDQLIAIARLTKKVTG